MRTCETCKQPIEKQMTFACSDHEMPIGARQRYYVKKDLCPLCSEIYKLDMLQKGIYMITRRSNGNKANQ